MKKILLATTALAAVSAVSVAQAQESAMMSAAGNDITVGGYYEFGYTTTDLGQKEATALDKTEYTQTYGDSELFIDFDATADSGLQYGVQVDLELINGNQHTENNNNKTAEEASIYVRSGWGTLDFGHGNPALIGHIITAPTHDGTLGQDDTIVGLTSTVGSGSLLTSVQHGRYIHNDDAKIRYRSPNFSGFRFSVSYADGDGNGHKATDAIDAGSTSFGASYGTDINLFGGFGLDIGVSTLNYNNSAYCEVQNIVGYTAPTPPTTAMPKADIKAYCPATVKVGSAAKKPGDNSYNFTNFGIGLTFGDLEVTVGNSKVTQGVYQKGGTGAFIDNERKITEFGIGYKVSDALSVGLARATATGDGTGEIGKDVKGTLLSASGSYNIAPGLKATLGYNSVSLETPARAKNNTSSPYHPDNLAKDRSSLVGQIEFAF